jgi:hypothetical protein
LTAVAIGTTDGSPARLLIWTGFNPAHSLKEGTMPETYDLAREQMRWAIDEAFRALMRAELYVHKYYEPTADERGNEATPVQNYLHHAHRSLKLALEELKEDQAPS